MTRAERTVRAMPTWMLKLALKLPSMRGLWAAAYIELWKREVEDLIAAETDNETGPWPVAMPRGMHSWILTAMLALAPGRDHVVLADAIDRVVAAESPLFKDDADKKKTSALLVAVAFRESSFRLDAVGDGGHSVCAFQIYDGPRELLTDADACVRRALSMLRTSVRVCPAHPVAWYAEGPRGCESTRAQRISRDRMALAGWLTRTVREEP